VALAANLVAFILAFLVLLADIDNISPTLQKDAILTYNVSYIGRDPAHYPADLAARIKGLVPQEAQNGASVTRYLGIPDWYSLYHFYTCRGWYAVDPVSGLLTDTKTSSFCERRPQSYVFTLRDTLAAELHPTVVELADDLPSGLRSLNAKVPTAFLIIGIIFTAFNLVILPQAVTGRIRINRLALLVSCVPMVSFLIAATVDTVVAVNAHRRGIGDLCSSFLGMIWATFALSVVVVVFANLEANFEAWTPPGQPITTYSRPPGANWMCWKEKHGERIGPDAA
jgi:uncharacterized membrane protein YozB (DUF420 family)